MKILTVTVILFSVFAILAGLGCASLSQYITPADIDPKAVDYAVEAAVAEPNEFAGWPNLDKALKLESAVNNAHATIQLALLQQIDKDQLRYGQLNNITVTNRQIAQAREQQLFGPEGLLTMGLSMAGFGTLTGIVGLMRKRPSDITPEELAQAISGKESELTEKQKQFVELVKGIQNFINTKPDVAETLKTELARVQSADTKTEVAKIKVTI